jgi:HEPN domain-containing protein
MRHPSADTLAKKATGDLHVARKLTPCSDIDDGVIGFYAQQAVEKSLKTALTLNGLDFPLMEHDLDLLLEFVAKGTVDAPQAVTDAGWLTLWATTYENCEAPPGKLDRRQAIAIAEIAVSWCCGLLDHAPPGQREDQAGDKPPPPPPSVPGLGRPETKRWSC